MKRHFALPAAVLLCALLLPRAASAANAWNDYHRLLDNYYLLDKQEARHVTCHVALPELNQMLDALRNGPLGPVVLINETLNDFLITYDRENGVSFDLPTLRIGFLTGETIPDPEKAEQARQVVEAGFKLSLNNAQGIIKGLFDDLVSPKAEERKNLSVTKKDGGTVVSYDGSGGHVESTYSGSSEVTKQSSSDMNFTATSGFTPLGGKLIFSGGTMKGVQGMTQIEGTVSATYQDLKTISFPLKIVGETNVNNGSRKAQQHVEINFKDCSTGK